MTQHILFIGGGNMATSLIGGLIANQFEANNLSVVETNADQRQLLAQKFAVKTDSSADTLISTTSIVVLAVKPHVLQAVCESLATHVQVAKPLIISIAAGVRSSDIERWLGGNLAVIRAMPNTPALIQCGASGLFANSNVDSDQKQQAQTILSATGLALWVATEADLDAVTALSGSGPAYYFRIMESMIKAGVEFGLTPETARLLTLQTALGAARMAQQSETDVALLRQQVTSPGGTTEQGLRVLEDNNIDQLMKNVVAAACQRSQELADQLGEQ